MSSDSTPHPSNKTPTEESKSGSAAGYAPYPKLEQEDAAPVADTWTATATSTTVPTSTSTTVPTSSNPYVSSDPVPPSPIKNNVEKVKGVLGKWGKQAAEATKKAEDLAGNMWQHLKTGPSMADAAVGSIARGTKVLAEGGHEKLFQKTFENAPEEKLLKYYGCYLSTSAGPVAGVIYLSTAKVAFCSDDPLQYKASESEEPRYSYYKVVIPLHQLKAVNASTSKVNSAEKYIQIISVDNHEFWFMGFVYYDSAVKNLQGALQANQL